MEKLKEGEKYLNISIWYFGKWFSISAFPNKNKKNEVEPDFIGEGVRVWVKKKRGKSESNVEVVEVL